MNKLARVASVAALMAALFAVQAPKAAAKTVCNGSFTGPNKTVPGPVIVPSGATCTLSQVTVTVAVIVKLGGTLNLSASTVNGPVTMNGATGDNVVCKSTIFGNLTVSNSTGSVRIGEPCGGNIITESVTISKNTGQLVFLQNSVGRHVTVRNNNSPTLSISQNVISGSLVCRDNNPAPTGGGNTARGVRQCAPPFSSS
jgi:hypothetical protein